MSGPRPRPPQERADPRIERQRVKSALFGSSPPRVGRFSVGDQLGAGGMGVVYRGHDPELGRDIAIKLMRPDRGGGRGGHPLLLREARAMARLSHPNVVPVFEVGEHEGQIFVAMELVSGTTLTRWLAQAQRDWRAIVAMFVGAGRGLEAAHEAGLVHRDFKPDNVLIGEDQRPRVVDFGLVGADRTAPQPRVDPTVSAGSDTVTSTLRGTPAYMAPEQLEGRPADPRSDQYALCLALWEALAGERPFVGTNVQEFALARRQPPRGAERLRGPRTLARALRRGLSHDAADRFASMTDLLEILDAAQPRSRTGWWLGAGTLATGLVIAALGDSARGSELCRGADRSLQGVWDDTRRQQIAEAILATSQPYAPDTWAQVEAQLDAYAQRWRARHTEACEATHVRKEQTEEVMGLRMDCLSTRRTALREAVRVLADAREPTVRRAVDLVAGLPGLARCDEIEALRAERPPPEDPRVAARVAPLRERLVKVRSLERAGEYARSEAEVQGVVAEAEALEYGPLLAEALLERGSVYDRSGRYEDAQQDTERAYLLALRHEHPTIELSAAASLVAIVGSRRARPAQGLHWGKVALALAERPGARPQDEAKALSNLGIVRFDQGHYERSLESFSRRLEVEQRAPDPDPLRVADALANVGVVLGKLSRYDEAMERFERALRMNEEVLGPQHPQIATLLNNIANTHKEQGRLQEALDGYRRARELRERTLGPTHPSVANLLANIGVVLGTLDRHDEAIDHHRRALEIRRAVLGLRHPAVGHALTLIATMRYEQARYDQARDDYQQALEIQRAGLDAGHPEIAITQQGLARSLWRLGDPDAAREHAEQAIAILEARPDHRHLLGTSLVDLGMALFADAEQHPEGLREGMREGLQMVRQARDIYAELSPAYRDRLALVEAWLRRASADAEQPRE